MKMYYRSKISALFEQEMDWKHSSGLEIPKKQCVKEQSNYVQALYNTESPEIKESVTLECTRLFDKVVK
jgi:hypothetical protein